MSQDRLKYDTTYTITLVNGDSSSSSEVVDIVTPSSSTLYITAYNHLKAPNSIQDIANLHLSEQDVMHKSSVKQHICASCINVKKEIARFENKTTIYNEIMQS
ncbi:hypothetical protein RI543_004828 [Arxiozyma heterogenica]|uniref:Uncharacterized protein n=1 Tax=Arxiozyma heterogenica TaxID=278026 RepID=A0AAN7ZRC7_9SACH|nr:hypothetical protein RI543_004828 [Kazachstania heterogenica]